MATTSTKSGVSFDGVHSYAEWGLRLQQITIGTPEAKTVYIDIPGMDGCLDLTEAQNGGVRYGMRTLEFVFDARHCTYMQWTGLVSRIARDLQGKKKKIILDIDSDYYYYGRCHIDTSKSNAASAEIVISCDCDPYKLSVLSSDEPWKWDTFSFIDGVIRFTKDIEISSPDDWQEVRIDGWAHNEILKIISSADMELKCRDSTYQIVMGENTMYDVEILEGKNSLYFKGNGTITIVYRGGMI